MSSISIHTIEKGLDQRLTEEARRNKKSKNMFVKELLAHSLGMPVEGRYADDYREFCGIWTSAERESFESFQKDNAQVDAGDWRA